MALTPRYDVPRSRSPYPGQFFLKPKISSSEGHMGFNATSRSVTLFRGIILSVVTLAGVGIIPNGLAKAHAQAPAVQLSTTSLNFGNQLVGTTTSVKSVTVTNVGTADLVISNIVAGGEFFAWRNCVRAWTVASGWPLVGPGT